MLKGATHTPTFTSNKATGKKALGNVSIIPGQSPGKKQVKGFQNELAKILQGPQSLKTNGKNSKKTNTKEALLKDLKLLAPNGSSKKMVGKNQIGMPVSKLGKQQQDNSKLMGEDLNINPGKLVSKLDKNIVTNEKLFSTPKKMIGKDGLVQGKQGLQQMPTSGKLNVAKKVQLNNVLHLSNKIGKTGNKKITSNHIGQKNGQMQAPIAQRLNLFEQSHKSQKPFLQAVDDRVAKKTMKAGLDLNKNIFDAPKGDSLEAITLRMPQPVTNADNGSLSTNISSSQVLDLSSISTEDSTAMIDRISNYIAQTAAANKESVTTSFKHNDLGQVDLIVNKARGDNPLNIQIVTHTAEGKDFFMKNQGLLSTALQTAGVKVGELSLASRENFNQEKDSDSENFAQNQNREYNGKDRRNDSERRKNLWNEFYNKDVA